MRDAHNDVTHIFPLARPDLPTLRYHLPSAIEYKCYDIYKSIAYGASDRTIFRSAAACNRKKGKIKKTEKEKGTIAFEHSISECEYHSAYVHRLMRKKEDRMWHTRIYSGGVFESSFSALTYD